MKLEWQIIYVYGSNKHFAKACKYKNICSFIFYIFNKINIL